VRGCARNGCDATAAATVALDYGPKEVVLIDLPTERDPNLLELCRLHTERLSPPLGWQLTDRRVHASSGG
jgi:uncharacterized protein DUF3499